MTGRGIDQILPYPGDPRLHEPFMTSAFKYVELTEHATGSLPHPATFDYIWGDVLPELERQSPDVRLINLETSITTSSSFTAAATSSTITKALVALKATVPTWRSCISQPSMKRPASFSTCT